MDKFRYLGRSVWSTENDISRWLVKVWTTINRLSVIWNSDQSNLIFQSVFYFWMYFFKFQMFIIYTFVYGIYVCIYRKKKFFVVDSFQFSLLTVITHKTTYTWNIENSQGNRRLIKIDSLRFVYLFYFLAIKYYFLSKRKENKCQFLP